MVGVKPRTHFLYYLGLISHMYFQVQQGMDTLKILNWYNFIFQYH